MSNIANERLFMDVKDNEQNCLLEAGIIKNGIVYTDYRFWLPVKLNNKTKKVISFLRETIKADNPGLPLVVKHRPYFVEAEYQFQLCEELKQHQRIYIGCETNNMRPIKQVACEIELEYKNTRYSFDAECHSDLESNRWKLLIKMTKANLKRNTAKDPVVLVDDYIETMPMKFIEMPTNTFCDFMEETNLGLASRKIVDTASRLQHRVVSEAFELLKDGE